MSFVFVNNQMTGVQQKISNLSFIYVVFYHYLCCHLAQVIRLKAWHQSNQAAKLLVATTTCKDPPMCNVDCKFF